MTIKTHLDLFSGIGGFALAASWAGFETIGFSEVDPFCNKILMKNFPFVENYGDIRRIHGEAFGGVDLITGGYPCQPFSHAGARRGAEDDRHLWPDMRRVISQARPAWVVAENVLGHVTMGLDEVLTDLEDLGYTGRPIVVPACAEGARHRRDRVWIVAHTEQHGLDEAEEFDSGPEVPGDGRVQEPEGHGSVCGGIWDWGGYPGPLEPPTEPAVRRTDDGVSARLDSSRLAALGNAIVPQVAYRLLKEMV